MNNMRITEANQNFTAFTRKVDAEGVVGIDKNSKLKYVMMTKAMFEEMNKNAYYGMRGSEIVKVDIGIDRAEIFQIYQENESHMVYTIAEVPANSVELAIKGNVLKVNVNLDEAPEAGRAYILSSEEFLDENGESIFHPDSSFEGDQFARRNLERCKRAIAEYKSAQKQYDAELSVIRSGEEQMEEYLKTVEGKDLWEPGKRTPRTK